MLDSPPQVQLKPLLLYDDRIGDEDAGTDVAVDDVVDVVTGETSTLLVLLVLLLMMLVLVELLALDHAGLELLGTL